MKKVIAFIIVVMVCVALVASVYGWIANVVYFFECDFEAPYKAEIVRAIGIPIGPVGSVMGFIHIDDGNDLTD